MCVCQPYIYIYDKMAKLLVYDTWHISFIVFEIVDCVELPRILLFLCNYYPPHFSGDFPFSKIFIISGFRNRSLCSLGQVAIYWPLMKMSCINQSLSLVYLQDSELSSKKYGYNSISFFLYWFWKYCLSRLHSSYSPVDCSNLTNIHIVKDCKWITK